MSHYLIYLIPFLFFLSHCTHNQSRVPAGQFSLTVETSGDVYSEEGGENSQIDLFGNCLPGQAVVYIEVGRKMMAANCRKGRYILSVNLPKSFLKRSKRARRSPSSLGKLTRISVFHRGKKDSRVTSYLTIDPVKKEASLQENK